MSSSKSRHSDVIVVILFVLAPCLVCNAAPSEQDVCVFHQSLIHLRSDLRLRAFAGGSEDQSLAEASYDRDAGSAQPEIKHVIPVDDLSASNSFVILRMSAPNDTTNITRNANETVVVSVKDDDENTTDTANVDDNTTDITVEHKVVKGKGRNHVVIQKVDAKDAKSDTHKHTNHKHTKRTVHVVKHDNTSASKPPRTNDEKDPEKPFAKENVTVHKHVLNITRRVNATANKTQNVTITETIKTVDVASPFHITSIYMVLFVPVAVAWAMYFNEGQQAYHYAWLLPFTMCAMSIGQDLVNQSLTLILEAPNAISAIQGFSMSVATCIWIWFVDWSAVRAIPLSNLTNWWGVAVFFAVYQLVNHLVYATCSLSERTVITNLTPLVSLGLERLVMPVGLKPSITFSSKLALGLMVIGAVLFSLQSPDFSIKGISIALLLLITMVPYRIAQRQFLAGGPSIPLATLACIDGFVLGVPSVIISIVRNVHFWNVVETSTEIPVSIMLVLSIMTFVGLHISGLAMLRIGSATTYLVFSNIASLVTIFLGIVFFGDHALATTLACIGLFANVASGIWYSAEVQARALAEQKEGVEQSSAITKDKENEN